MTAQLPSSKEQLLADIAHAEEKAATLCGPCADDHARLAGYLRALLAAHEQEPAEWATYYPDTDEESGREHSRSNEATARRIASEINGYVVPVYYGKPAPVPAVPDVELIRQLKTIWWDSEDCHCMSNDTALKIILACRAAMLNGG